MKIHFSFKNRVQFLLLVLALLTIVSCAPRGETKSLDEILEIASGRYSEALQKDVSPALKGELAELAANLQNVLNGKSVSESSLVVSKKLHELAPKAGYTSRPAMSELAKQYATLSEDEVLSDNEKSGRTTLLVSRTYSILAQELETMKFRLG